MSFQRPGEEEDYLAKSTVEQHYPHATNPQGTFGAKLKVVVSCDRDLGDEHHHEQHVLGHSKL